MRRKCKKPGGPHTVPTRVKSNVFFRWKKKLKIDVFYRSNLVLEAFFCILPAKATTIKYTGGLLPAFLRVFAGLGARMRVFYVLFLTLDSKTHGKMTTLWARMAPWGSQTSPAIAFERFDLQKHLVKLTLLSKTRGKMTTFWASMAPWGSQTSLADFTVFGDIRSVSTLCHLVCLFVCLLLCLWGCMLFCLLDCLLWSPNPNIVWRCTSNQKPATSDQYPVSSD